MLNELGRPPLRRACRIVVGLAASVHVLCASCGRVSFEQLDDGHRTDRIVGPVALYLFAEGSGSIVRDSSPTSPPLDLTWEGDSSPTWQPGAATFPGGGFFASSSTAAKVLDACRASDALTLEAWVEPVPAAQTGPSRIVTFSASSDARNFTLATGGEGPWDGAVASYGVRVRSTQTGENGLPQLSTPEGSAEARLTHLVATRTADGTRRIYVDAELAAEDEIGGGFETWDPAFRLAIGGELDHSLRYFSGALHLVAVYARALTPEEVRQNLEAGPDPEL